MNLLDSDSLTLIFHRQPAIRRRAAAAAPEGELALPVIVRLEALRGRIAAVRKAATGADVLRMQQRLADTEQFLARFPVVAFDATAGDHFDRLRASRPCRGISNDDLMIASIALAREATLVTRNLKDFAPVPGLKVENWAD